MIPQQLSALAGALRTGELPLTTYLDHLEAGFATHEPDVQAFMPEPARFERVRREAEMLQRQFPKPASRPLLFGVPVGVKDIFHVDGLPTTGGSRLPPNELKGEQAASVTALKNVGALVLGKTVSTEFAYFGPGATRNPHNLAHTPGGSSSGSAAAVGAGLCPLTLGTQTIGSIVRPAAFCGVVGFKPTYERASRAGVIPLSPSLDHIGLFAPDVPGIALAARALLANWTAPTTARKPTLGIPEGEYLSKASAEGLAHFHQTCERLARAGYTLVRVSVMPDFDEIVQRHNLIVAADAAQVHSEWYSRYATLYHPKTVELIERGKAVSQDSLAHARAGRAALREQLSQAMRVHGVDVWVSPAAPGTAPAGLESTGSPVMNLPWTHAGLPALNLPAGNGANGLPLGLQLTAGWNADEQLLQWAVDVEKALNE